jgi:hypothetical protein
VICKRRRRRKEDDGGLVVAMQWWRGEERKTRRRVRRCPILFSLVWSALGWFGAAAKKTKTITLVFGF